MHYLREFSQAVINLNILIFNYLVGNLFKRNSQEGSKIWRFTEIKLKQFNLAQAYDPQEILSIAYERSVKAIIRGQQIETQSITPWFKSVIFNIVRELRRERDKERVKRKDIPDGEIIDNSKASEIFSWEESPYRSKYEKLMEYLKTLPPLEQQLIKLRAEQALSWSEIADNLSKQNFVISSEQALRKRYSRLRIKIKSQFK